MTTIVLAEDNAILREGMVRLLDTIEGLEVIGTASHLPGLFESVAQHLPDVVITDIRMPPTHSDEGIQAAARLREEHPQIGVVVFSQHVTPRYALDLLGDGTSGRAYLLKDRVSDVGQLAAAVQAVATGGSVIDPSVVDELVAARTRRGSSPIKRLTPRQLEVLGHVAQGKSNAAIASDLFLSERAVEKNITAIMQALGIVDDRAANRRVKAVLAYLASSPEAEIVAPSAATSIEG